MSGAGPMLDQAVIGEAVAKLSVGYVFSQEIISNMEAKQRRMAASEEIAVHCQHLRSPEVRCSYCCC
uniref:Uncharacterized protein n=1 Tax=Parascaris equorum TaxID=6256 RepID=A0A914RKN4_PAREQ